LNLHFPTGNKEDCYIISTQGASFEQIEAINKNKKMDNPGRHTIWPGSMPDFGGPAYRYRDALEQKDYDYAGLAANVTAGVAVSLGLGILSYGIGTLVVSGSTAAGLEFSVFIGGTWYVGTQAVSDVLGGRVSSRDTYLRKGLVGVRPASIS